MMNRFLGLVALWYGVYAVALVAVVTWALWG
jgi:hypothetical protein